MFGWTKHNFWLQYHNSAEISKVHKRDFVVHVDVTWTILEDVMLLH